MVLGLGDINVPIRSFSVLSLCKHAYISVSVLEVTYRGTGRGLHADAENLEKLRPTLDAFPLSHEDKSGP